MPTPSPSLTSRTGPSTCEAGTCDRIRRRNDITKLAPYKYDPNVTCPAFLRFLNTVFGSDEEVIRFVQRALGSRSLGEAKEQVMFFARRYWRATGSRRS